MTPRKILVADEDLDTRIILRTLLARDGYAVIEAASARAATEAAQQFPFSLIILNYPMRVGDGLTLPAMESPIKPKGVVLELKYNGRIPHWMQDLIASFGLQRQSFPKYVHCVDALKDSPEPAGCRPRSVRW